MNQEDDAKLAYLMAVNAIQMTKARYCRFVDTKQWYRLRTLFTADCRFEGLGSAPDRADLDTFIEGISRRLADVVSVHHCHMGEIELVGADEAKVIWAMEDHLEWQDSDEVVEAPGSRGFRGYGHYEECYVRQGDTWKISLLRLTRIGVHPIPDAQPRLGTGRLEANPDWLPSDRCLR
ncbi:nuclear transport factor 2 family protein [Paraburkholderia sp. IW21]|uniref:nuclear transport factor 2 family protein n=1 Tax=Paraburkholderia sp. IW21 TaxID=3242488 RepID=UPI0035228DD4